jgi:GNAT superfamily N-acetyltransferase
MYVRLSDDRLLHVRPIAARDKPLLEAALRRLSPRSARARFLGAKPRLTSAELAYLTEVDGGDHVALVAVPAERPDELVAVARYVRLADDPDCAEIAVVVADAYQGHGLGVRLGLELATRARAQGIRRFTGLMLAENRAAHRLLEAISDHSRTRHEPAGVDRMVAELAA